MTGWKLISHSLFLLRYNFKDAIRISAPLFAMMGVGLVIGGPDLIESLRTAGSSQGSAHHVMFLFAVCIWLWVAVGWHRLVLLEEFGHGLPALHLRPMAAYFGRFLMILSCASFACVMVGFVVVAYSRRPDFWFFSGIASAAATGLWLFLRLSPTLPAAALGHSITLHQAWRATIGQSGAMFLAGVVLMVCYLVSSALAIIIFAEIHRLSGALLFVVVQWAYVMWGASMLTTIYGVTVEKRSL